MLERFTISPAAAVIIGLLCSFSIEDAPICATTVSGYLEPIDSKQFLVPNTYGVHYLCSPSETEVCRWVKLADGRFTPCHGKLMILIP